MKILFIHQNFPGQYLHLAPKLAACGHEVTALGDDKLIKQTRKTPGVARLGYPSAEPGSKQTHNYLHNFEMQIKRGQRVARALLRMKDEGFKPDVIHVHPGWGEALYLKDIFPDVPVIGLFEYYYHGQGHDLGFDPEFPVGLDDMARVRTWNANNLLALELADAGVCPTEYQKSVHPSVYHDKIEVIHDGIDTDAACPGSVDSLSLATDDGLRKFSDNDEIVTFVSRNLEPYRGYHSFMRAVPKLLERPETQIVIVGGDRKGYGKLPKEGGTWKALYAAELDGHDSARVHFVPRVPYDKLVKILRLSRAHVYLTYPFVLSWGMLDAMSCGAPIVGSRTEPVEEFIEEGRTGLLVDFFDSAEIADAVVRLLDDAMLRGSLGHAARESILESYSIARCLPKQMELIAQFA